MGKIIRLSIIVAYLFTSCVQHADKNKDEHQNKRNEKVKIENAKGFDIVYKDAYIKIITHSLDGNSFFEDSLFILQNEMPGEFTEKRKTVPAKWKSVCCQSSTHLAFLNTLNKLDLVTGLCGVQYVNKGAIKKQLKQNKTAEICIGESTQAESILAQNPDVYFIYPFSAEQNVQLEKQGVRTFMIAEYLERDPIDRLEWIKLFGVLFNKEKAATMYFDRHKKAYEKLKENASASKQTFFMNLPFGDTWYAPSSASLIVSLIEDAGLSYYFKTDKGTENRAYPAEEIWDLGAQLEYWVIIANRPKDYSMDDLIAENEVYTTFKAVRRNQVIFCNTATTNYFIQGVMEPDVMLKDILHAQNKYPDHTPVYFRLLN